VAQRRLVAQIYFYHLVTLSVFGSLWQILSSFYPCNGVLLYKNQWFSVAGRSGYKSGKKKGTPKDAFYTCINND